MLGALTNAIRGGAEIITTTQTKGIEDKLNVAFKATGNLMYRTAMFAQSFFKDEAAIEAKAASTILKHQWKLFKTEMSLLQKDRKITDTAHKLIESSFKAIETGVSVGNAFTNLMQQLTD